MTDQPEPIRLVGEAIAAHRGTGRGGAFELAEVAIMALGKAGYRLIWDPPGDLPCHLCGRPLDEFHPAAGCSPGPIGR